jgi:alpha-amylase
MSSICFYFHVHQPWRVKRYRIFDVGHDHFYFNEKGDINVNNEKILKKVAEKCYIPTNKVLKELLDRHPEFKFSFSFSGVLLEQLEEFAPHVLESFQELVRTGRVEIVSETYYHSLAFIYSHDEFRKQVALHKEKIKQLFDYVPTSFRNTELIFRNDLVPLVDEMGFKAVLTEGWDPLLGWRSPNFLYRSPQGSNVKIFTKNYRLSDDVAFRFSSRAWKEWPLTAQKFAEWVNQVNGNGNVVNLFMDYETFGEHQWADTGIFDFLRAVPGELLKHSDNDFTTIREAAERYPAVGEYDVRDLLSWADTERDVSAWIGNRMQQESLHGLYQIRDRAMSTQDRYIIQDWRRLSTSDHFYYMCTKWFADGDVHKYFSPYDTPYEAFIAFMNALRDLEFRITKHELDVSKKPELTKVEKKRQGPARRKKKVLTATPKKSRVVASLKR